MELQAGKVATGEGFTGRDKLLETISLYMDMKQSIVLIAPRRFGKTSLIKKLIETKTRYKSIEIDLMKVYNTKDLAEKIIEETYKLVGINNFIEYAKKFSVDTLTTLTKIVNNLSLTIDDVEIGVSLKLFEAGDEYALLEHAFGLPEKMAEKLDIEIIFAIDELGEVVNLKNHTRILEMMRSIFQHSKKVNYVFAGSQYSLMNNIFTDKNSPFFRFAEPITVPPMNADEFRDFFNDVFRRMDISLYDTFTEDIVNIAGGIPYYITKIAQIVLVETKISGKINTYRWNICKAALLQYYREETYFNQELSRLRGKKHFFQVLKSLSANGDPYKEMKEAGVQRQNVRKIFKSLEDDGLISQKGSKYLIIDPFMKRYIKKEL